MVSTSNSHHQEMGTMSIRTIRTKFSPSLSSYSFNVLMIIMIAIAFTNWKGCRNYREGHLVANLGWLRMILTMFHHLALLLCQYSNLWLQ